MNTELHIKNFNKFFDELNNMPDDKAYILPFGAFGVIVKDTKFATNLKFIKTDGLLEKMVLNGNTTWEELETELNKTAQKHPERCFSYIRCMPNGNMNTTGMSFTGFPSEVKDIKSYFLESLLNVYTEGGLEFNGKELKPFIVNESDKSNRVICYYIFNKDEAFNAIDKCVDTITDTYNWTERIHNIFDIKEITERNINAIKKLGINIIMD